jgi:hypothetical protein
MAKAQQNLVTAWFAASAGAEDVSIPVFPRPRRAQRQALSGLGKQNGSGPIDIDSGAEYQNAYDARSVSSESSSGLSKMQSFLGGVFNSGISSVANADQNTIMTGETPRINNFSPKEASDVEMASSTFNSIYAVAPLERRCCFRRRSAVTILVLVFGIALATSLISLALTQNRTNNNDTITSNESGNDSLTVPPLNLDFPTEAPSILPTFVESTFPSSIHPSQSPTSTSAPSTKRPSFKPTVPPSAAPTGLQSDQPSDLPTVPQTSGPSSSPTAQPTVVPSSMPTKSSSFYPTSGPSESPSLSRIPSASPSLAPTTVFSTTSFRLDGEPLLGQQESEQFGYATSLSGDGSILAVGARYFGLDSQERVGKVQVYKRQQDNSWSLMGQALLGRNIQDQFGYSVALNHNGTILAASEPGYDGFAGDRSGSVRIFAWKSNAWIQLGQGLEGEGVASLFGLSISLSMNGRRIAIGSPYLDGITGTRQSGRVRIFELQQGQWVPLGQAIDGTGRVDWFGWSVSLSPDGRRFVAGAPRNRDFGGYVRCFDLDELQLEWRQTGNDIINNLLQANVEDRFGQAVSLDRNRIAIGAPWKEPLNGILNAGVVAVYEQTETDVDWNLIGSPIEGQSFLGQTGTSIQLRGDYMVIGSLSSLFGQVSFHRYTGVDWDTASSPMEGKVPHQDFGFSISTNDDASLIVVGAPATAHPDLRAGSVSVFRR